MLEKVKPKAVQRPDDAKSIGPKTDALLTEQTVSNKEQRKADWAIMKEMVQYLWPKVALFLALDISFSALLTLKFRETWAQKSE